MEQHREKPDSSAITKLVHDKALEYANRIFHDAYAGQPFSRITVEDLNMLLVRPEFYDLLHCVAGGGLGDELRAELFQYNVDRQKAVSNALSTQAGTDQDDREALQQQLHELHHRPPKPQNPDMF
jgi:hypothetical protein